MNKLLPAKLQPISEELKKKIAEEVIAGKIQLETGLKIKDELYTQMRPELKEIIDKNNQERKEVFADIKAYVKLAEQLYDQIDVTITRVEAALLQELGIPQDYWVACVNTMAAVSPDIYSLSTSFANRYNSETADGSLTEEEIKTYLREQIKILNEESEQIIAMSQHLVK